MVCLEGGFGGVHTWENHDETVAQVDGG